MAGLKVTPCFLVGSAVLEFISSKLIIQRVLNGVCVNALIDTGSVKSSVSKDTLTCIQLPPCLQSSSHNCVSITSQPLQIEGTAHLTLSIPSNDICFIQVISLRPLPFASHYNVFMVTL